jgi:hypothetical protein
VLSSLREVQQVDYLTVKETGEKWGITARMVTYYCVDGRIAGAIKKGNLWLVPANAEKPIDGRTKNSESKNEVDA